MKKVLIVLLCLFQAACVGSIRSGAPAVVYDFGLPAKALGPVGDWSRLMLEVKSPPWFDSLYVNYRLAYDDPLKQREYAGSRWAGAPDILLAQSLRQQLGVAGAERGATAECQLRVDLLAFTQVFETPTLSHGLLQAQLTLMDRKRQLLAGKRMTIEKPARTADAHGGVVALVATSEALGRQTADWLADLEAAGGLRVCRLSSRP